MSTLQQRFINSIYNWKADDIRQELKSLRLSSTGSKQQLVERLQNHYQTNDPDLQPPTTPASSDGAAPTPASDHLPNQNSDLMNSDGDDGDGNQANQPITGTPAGSAQERGDNFSASTTQTSTTVTGDQLQTDVSTSTTQQPAISAGQIMHANNFPPNVSQNLGIPNVPVHPSLSSQYINSQGGTTSHNVSSLTWSSGQSTGGMHTQPATNQPHTLQGMSHAYHSQGGYPMIPHSSLYHMYGQHGYPGITPNYPPHQYMSQPYHSMPAVSTGVIGGTPPYPVQPMYPAYPSQPLSSIGITPNSQSSISSDGVQRTMLPMNNFMGTYPPPSISVSAPTPAMTNQGQTTTSHLPYSAALDGSMQSSLQVPQFSHGTTPNASTGSAAVVVPNHLSSQTSRGTTPNAPTGSAVVVQPSHQSGQVSRGTTPNVASTPAVAVQSLNQISQLRRGTTTDVASTPSVTAQSLNPMSHVLRRITPSVSNTSIVSQSQAISNSGSHTASGSLSGNSQVMQTPMLPNYGNSLYAQPTVTPNLASTRYDHQTSSDPQSELSSLEMELKILQTREQIRNSQFRLTKSPDELHQSSLNMTSSMEVNASMLQLVKQSVDLNSLPPTKPFKFSGDIIEYPKWKTLFDLMVESKNLFPHQKLIFLSDYLSGEPLDLVKGYCSLNTEEAYQQARRELDERYGDPIDITEAYRDRLEDWPRIGDNDAKSLRKYADFLGQCVLTMSSISDLCKLNDPRDMKRLPHVLPDRLINKWSTKAGNLKYNKQTPTFNDYTEFVKKEAFLANSNTTSVDAFMKVSGNTTKKPANKKPTSKPATTLTTNTDSPAPEGAKSKNQQSDKSKLVCHHCDSTESHNTADCYKVGKMTNDEQQEFIKSKHLCFWCLRKGHSSGKCHTKLKCKRKGCTANHATCRHDKQKKSSESTEETTTAESVAMSMHSEEISELTTMILPVYISSPDQPDDEHLVYAMVDSMSDTTFMATDIASNLNMKSRPAKLKISTLTSRNQIVRCRKYSYLRVRGMNSDEVIHIPQTYSQTCIPGNRSHIPTPTTARRWDHLKQLADKIAPLQTCDISLLIGFNCPAASCPRTKVEGLQSEPYAVETVLGWSVIGGICRDGQQVRLSHRITTEELLPDDVLNCMEEDLSVDHNAKPMSQNDFWFVKKMNEAVTTNEEGFYTMPLPLKEEPNIPDNRSYAMRRFRGLERRLQADPQLNIKYREFMAEIIAKGEAEVCKSTGPGWYIPHHGVFHPHKPGKLREIGRAHV